MAACVARRRCAKRTMTPPGEGASNIVKGSAHPPAHGRRVYSSQWRTTSSIQLNPFISLSYAQHLKLPTCNAAYALCAARHEPLTGHIMRCLLCIWGVCACVCVCECCSNFVCMRVCIDMLIERWQRVADAMYQEPWQLVTGP